MDSLRTEPYSLFEGVQDVEAPNLELATALEILKVAEGLVYSCSTPLVKKYDSVKHNIMAKYFEKRRKGRKLGYNGEREMVRAELDKRLEQLQSLEEEKEEQRGEQDKSTIQPGVLRSPQLPLAEVGEEDEFPLELVDELEDALVERAIVLRDELAETQKTLDFALWEWVGRQGVDERERASWTAVEVEEDELESPTALVLLQARRWCACVRRTGEGMLRCIESVLQEKEKEWIVSQHGVLMDHGTQTTFSAVESRALAVHWERQHEERVRILEDGFHQEAEALREQLEVIELETSQVMKEERSQRLFVETSARAAFEQIASLVWSEEKAKEEAADELQWSALIAGIQQEQERMKNQERTIRVRVLFHLERENVYAQILREQNKRLVRGEVDT